MPNYILSRTSPPAQFYERKINLGYGVKVDTSDAPTAEPKKEKKMEDVKEPVVDAMDNVKSGINDFPEINAFASASALDAAEAQEAKEAKEASVN